MIQGELHILSNDVLPTCSNFKEKMGPLDSPTRRKRMTSPRRIDLLKVSRNTTYLADF